MASGYRLVLGWLAFSYPADLSPESSVRELPHHLWGLLIHLYWYCLFFGFGLGFSDLRISFWLLSFGVLGDLQLGDLSGFRSFLNGIFPYFQFRVTRCVLWRRSLQLLELSLQSYETKPQPH